MMKAGSFMGLATLFIKVVSLFTTILVSFAAIAQNNESYTILVAGHAYGAHAGTNIGLHPPFLNKLQQEKDSIIEGLFLTGDIINNSNAASWAQVEKELSAIGIPSYYIMGNHDNNTIGKSVFVNKHGGLYYSLVLHDDLYVILNSTESDCSISSSQLAFLTDVLQKATAANKRIFIFFHEVIWNSHVKYRLVRSNSRSRYDQIKTVSNFWNKVVPVLDAYPQKSFYLFSGDVGGNPDAIAAFYDRWDHMTLLSSGMGEVADENYLKVNIRPDTVTFSLIPLNSSVKMHPISWYNVPARPKGLTGPSTVHPPELGIKYEAEPVFNATSYAWTLSSGTTRNTDSTIISLDFDASYQTGSIGVKAVNDGFGESDPVSLTVNASGYTSARNTDVSTSIDISQDQQYICVNFYASINSRIRIKIYDLTGKMVYEHPYEIHKGSNITRINKNLLGKGLFIMDFYMDNKRHQKKVMLY